VSSGFSYCRHALSALMMRLRNAMLRAALLVSGWLKKLWRNLSRAVSGGYPYYRHSLPVRIMHWSNVVLLAILLMSGLNIFEAHPALYWGKQSYGGAQIGAQEKDIILVFMNDAALKKFRASKNWQAGVDAQVTLVNVGADESLDTTKFKQPVIGFVFGHKGLMAGATIEGSKFTKLKK